MPSKANEMKHVTDVMAVWELRGDYPDVPLAPDVDYAALVAGDEQPMFVTLPIGKVDAKSANGRYYDESFVQELERQVLENKPVGLMGHLRAADRATEFPLEAVHWVGAQRVGELLWGKGYVPPGEARERIRRYKAQNKKIATSIDAWLEATWDEAKKAYRALAKGLKLNQIDIAPADRAGIPDLAAVPRLSTEMSEEPKQVEINPMAEKLEIIREMTAEDADLLPKPVREAILASTRPAPEVELVSQLREALGADEKADLVSIIREMKIERERAAAESVQARVVDLVADPETGVKVEALRGLVTELVMARRPGTPDEAAAAYQAVVAGESVKAALAAHVRETMGPPQGTPVAGQNGKAKYFVIPEETS
jgi:hypothetical protein